MYSSLGFHTLGVSKWLLEDFGESEEELVEDFKNYSKKAHNIQIYTDNFGNTVIKFYKDYPGIEWKIRSNIWIKKAKRSIDIVDVKINPKILSGISTYTTAATYDDMDDAITNFNNISNEISPILGTFKDYELKRIDYCINFSLNELVPGYTYAQIIDLIKRSDIPYHFKEWTEYDPISHRKKSKPGSFYLTNNSVHINCYSKYMQLQDQTKENIKKGYPPIPQKTLDTAQDIIRFEVQCKYHKIYANSREAKDNGNEKLNLYEDLLSQDTCKRVINSYFSKIIGMGHWYSLQAAKALIKSRQFNAQKETRLIGALELVSQCRGVAAAKESCQGDGLESLKRTLTDLNNLGINPVTIPQRWGVDRIWNLLDAYYSKLSKERTDKQFEEELFQDIFFIDD